MIEAPEKVVEVKLELLNNREEVVSESRGFYLERPQGIKYAAILAIPAFLEEDLENTTYLLQVKGEIDGPVFKYTKPILILAKDFPLEKIHLGDDLTDLITKPDQRKAEEARQLFAVFDEFNSGAIYQREPFFKQRYIVNWQGETCRMVMTTIIGE